MHELTKEEFSIVIPFIKDINHKAVYSLSVIEQKQEGRVFINDYSVPTAIFITSCGGFYCLVGDESDDKFIRTVIDFMNTPTNHPNFFALALFTELWDKKLDLFQINNSKKVVRSYYRFNEERFLKNYPNPLNNSVGNLNYQKLNSKIANEYRVHFYPYYQLVWETDSHFCEQGIGHFFTKDAEIISVCTSPYVGGGFAEIDIITLEEYKRKGLATHLGVQFIYECINKQLIPNWCCHSENIESNRLAEKLGFEKVDERPIYWNTV